MPVEETARRFHQRRRERPDLLAHPPQEREPVFPSLHVRVCIEQYRVFRLGYLDARLRNLGLRLQRALDVALHAERVQRGRERSELGREPLVDEPLDDVQRPSGFAARRLDAREGGVGHLGSLDVELDHLVEDGVRALGVYRVLWRDDDLRRRQRRTVGGFGVVLVVASRARPAGAQVEEDVEGVRLEGLAGSDRGVEGGERRGGVALGARDVDLASSRLPGLGREVLRTMGRTTGRRGASGTARRWDDGSDGANGSGGRRGRRRWEKGGRRGGSRVGRCRATRPREGSSGPSCASGPCCRRPNRCCVVSARRRPWRVGCGGSRASGALPKVPPLAAREIQLYGLQASETKG